MWHQDFGYKDCDDGVKYFSIRNSVIAAALHHDVDGPALGKALGRELLRYAVSMQYGLARTAIAGIEDFLSGPEVLADGGASALQRVRAMRVDFPETVVHPATDVPGVPQSHARTVLAGHTPKKADRPRARRAHRPAGHRSDDRRRCPNPGRQRTVVARRAVRHGVGDRRIAGRSALSPTASPDHR